MSEITESDNQKTLFSYPYFILMLLVFYNEKFIQIHFIINISEFYFLHAKDLNERDE